MAKILIIDDDDTFRKMLHDMLSRAGHTVVAAENGSRGIELYREGPADLVITDIIMPEKEGVETIRELHRDFPDVRIIAISGGGGAGKMEAGLTLKMVAALPGVASFLEKPFSKTELFSAIEQAL